VSERHPTEPSTETAPPHGFLADPPLTADVQALYDGDVEDVGYVMNLSRLWGHDPSAHESLFDLLGEAVAVAGLSFRQRGLLVSATASTIGDSYCSLAWGNRLAAAASPDVAASVLTGADDDPGLDATDRALVRWARAVVGRPARTTPEDLQPLRDAGFDDRQIFGITLFVSLRQAFSTVNGALGARPDSELVESAPHQVHTAVSYGRPAAAPAVHP
jgi:alkylhydroperoxidase family enzyme